MQPYTIKCRNLSKRYGLKNGYIVCSHPLIFGFNKLRLFDRIEPEQEFFVEFQMKASLMNSIEIKFLIRYEVDIGPEGGEELDSMSKYRFSRLVFNMETNFSFMLKRHVNLSTKKANEHIINVQVVD